MESRPSLDSAPTRRHSLVATHGAAAGASAQDARREPKPRVPLSGVGTHASAGGLGKLMCAASAMEREMPVPAPDPWDDVSWITEDLALSSHICAQDRRTIVEGGFRGIISIGTQKALEGDGWEVIWFREIQGEEMPDQLIPAVLKAIDDSLAQGKTLVHCTAGASRSAGLVALWLATRRHMTWQEAVELVKERRPVVDIDDVVETALRGWLHRHTGGH